MEGRTGHPATGSSHRGMRIISMTSKDASSPAHALLGRNLRRLREARALSLADLSGRSGIAQRRVAAFEQGCGTCRLDDLGRLASALSVSIAALLAPDEGP